MNEPKQAEEPSMEEILASIRRIISDDAESQPQVDLPATVDDDALKEDIDDPAPSDVLELTEEVSVPESYPGQSQRLSGDSSDDVSKDVSVVADNEIDENHLVFHDVDESESPVSDVKGDNDAPAEADLEMTLGMNLNKPVAVNDDCAKGAGLLSPQADACVNSAFEELGNLILSSHSRTLEDLISDMLRPMLKEWLDVNLPQMVENMVRNEIERVTRGKR